MDLTLPGRYGEFRITPQMLDSIDAYRLEKFQVELEKIAEREGLAVEIDERIHRGYIIRWWPADEPSSW